MGTTRTTRAATNRKKPPTTPQDSSHSTSQVWSTTRSASKKKDPPLAIAGHSSPPADEALSSIQAATEKIDKIQTTPTSRNLRFQPLAGHDYAKEFAEAVRAAFKTGYISQGAKNQVKWAERILEGKGGSLVFRQGYIDSLGGDSTWNGIDVRVRRGAFIHMFGATTKECKVPGCLWKEAGIDAVCRQCRNLSGHFDECRHDHEMGKNGQCSNCAASCTSSKCTFCQKTNDNVNHKRKAEDVDSSRPVQVRKPSGPVVVKDGVPITRPFCVTLEEVDDKGGVEDFIQEIRKAMVRREEGCVVSDAMWMAKLLLLHVSELKERNTEASSAAVEVVKKQLRAIESRCND